jgi:steroid delta-isomerase-like uncharacterized protein
MGTPPGGATLAGNRLPDAKEMSPVADATPTGARERSASLDRAFVDEFYPPFLAVWNDHDTTHLDQFVTDDVVWIDPLLTEPARGVDAVRRFMEACWASMPDLHFEITGAHCLADDAPVLMVPWKMTGTHLASFDPPGFAPTGRRIDIDGIDVYTFRAGKVAEYRAYYDNAEQGRQLGILPATSSRGERAIVALQRLSARLRGRQQ